MNLSEDDLKRMGYTIREGRAIRALKGVMPSESSARSSAAAEDLRSGVLGGVTHPLQTRPNKYRNKPCYVGDLRFDSKHEAECWLALKARQDTGDIQTLDRQFAFDLHCGTDSGLRLVVCQYVADFVWFGQNGEPHVADAKSIATKTQLYKLKAKWMNLEYGIVIEEL